MRRVILCSVGVLSLLTAASAEVYAQDKDAAEAAVDPERRARLEFEAGREAFNEGAYEDALANFQRAHRLSGRSQLLYNIALTYDRLRLNAEALAAYEQYLKEFPDGPESAELRRRTEILRTAVERAASANSTEPEVQQSPTPQGPPPGDGEPELPASEGTSKPSSETVERASVIDTRGPARTDESSSSVLPLVIIGGSAAVAIGGAVLIGIGQGKASDVEDAADGSRWADVEGSASSAETLSTVGLVMVAVGLAGAATGVTLAVLGGDEQSDARVRVGLGGLSVTGAF